MATAGAARPDTARLRVATAPRRLERRRLERHCAAGVFTLTSALHTPRRSGIASPGGAGVPGPTNNGGPPGGGGPPASVPGGPSPGGTGIIFVPGGSSVPGSMPGGTVGPSLIPPAVGPPGGGGCSAWSAGCYSGQTCQGSSGQCCCSGCACAAAAGPAPVPPALARARAGRSRPLALLHLPTLQTGPTLAAGSRGPRAWTSPPRRAATRRRPPPPLPSRRARAATCRAAPPAATSPTCAGLAAAPQAGHLPPAACLPHPISTAPRRPAPGPDTHFARPRARPRASRKLARARWRGRRAAACRVRPVTRAPRLPPLRAQPASARGPRRFRGPSDPRPPLAPPQRARARANAHARICSSTPSHLA